MDLEKLKQAAENEDWNTVDAEIPKMCDEPEAIKQAERWLDNLNPNVRDLGASILEKAKKLDKNAKPKLYSVIEKKGQYDRFRAACALAAHGEYNDKVKNILKEFEQDPDVTDIAKDYLSRF